MFVELFIVDNLLMDLLALRLASAMLSVKCPPFRAFSFALAGAVSAAFLFPALPRLPLFIRLLGPVLASFALPGRGTGRLLALFAALTAFAAEGGAALLAAFAVGGISEGVTLPAALTGGALAAALPIIIRRLLARRVPDGMTLRLEAELSTTGAEGGTRLECAALIDTGCSLTDPLTGLPVIVLPEKRFPEAAKRAFIPIPMRTANGPGHIRALRPKRLTVDGRPVDALIAFAPTHTALAPPCLAPPTDKGGKHAQAYPKTDREAV